MRFAFTSHPDSQEVVQGLTISRTMQTPPDFSSLQRFDIA